MTRLTLWRCLGCALLLSLATLPAAAQDPVSVAPDVYKVIVDNPSVRVLDVHVAPGTKIPMHSHPANLVVAFTPCKVRFTAPDGKAVEADIKAGDVLWSEAESHAAENLGTSECHVINVEMKPAAAMPH